MTPEEKEDAERSYRAYCNVQEVLCDGEYTNGDVLFVLAMILGEIIREESYDFEEVMQEVREVALKAIKVHANA